MRSSDEISKIAILIASSVAISFVVYNLVNVYMETGSFLRPTRRRKKSDEDDEKDELVELLQALDNEDLEKSSLIFILSNLADRAAFTIVQDRIHELGYLPKIMNFLNHPDHNVKIQAALLINNLSLNERNQTVLKESIPSLISIIRHRNITNDDTVTLFMAVLNALTNLTTLNTSHSHILPSVGVLSELLQECNVAQIKLQVLKILVNLSTNDKLCENMLELDAQLLKSVEPYISKDIDERYVLRAVSCCANVLTSLHRRWQFGKYPVVATPEFVNEKFREQLVRLTSHETHDIRLQAGRSLIALRTPVNEITVESLDEIDILDVLKI